MEVYSDGELVEDTRIDRTKIGEETKQVLRDCENVEDVKKFLARILDIELDTTQQPSSQGAAGQ